MDRDKTKIPVIGICVSAAKWRFQKLAEERLEQYPGDLIVIMFHIEDLDFDNLRVNGIFLEKKGRKLNRQEGFFSLPGAVYMQCLVDNERMNRLEKVTGGRVFNNFIFDKWECWDLLKRNDDLHNHLPDTQKLENREDLKPFLHGYEDIFLKPDDAIHGHSSKGIVQVKLQKEGNIRAFYRAKDKMRKKEFESYRKFLGWMSRRLSKHEYIMQQSIQTVKWDKEATDIRLNMNKNGKGDWEVTLLLFRIASNGSHMTPVILAAEPVRNLTKLYPTLNMEGIETDTVNLGYKICGGMEESGYHMGDLGIDLGVDEKGHLWIFEVNPLPRPLKGVQDRSITMPFEYAAYLAQE